MPRFQPIERPCAHCGTNMLITRRVESDRKFCGHACYRAHEREQPSKAMPRVELVCKWCSGTFTRQPSEIAAYRRRFGKDPMYCSIPCSALGRREDTKERNVFTCKGCGKLSPMKHTILKTTGRAQYHRLQQFCGVPCKAEYQRRKAAERFLSGEKYRHVKKNGYVWMSIPANISPTGKKCEMLEHRYVMEQSIGRPLLPEETVHHINGVRDDNRLENLELFSSRHGPGQRVRDKIDFAVEMIALYPEFLSDTHRSELAKALAHITPPASP